MAKKMTNTRRRTKVKNPALAEQELTEKEAKQVKGGAIRKGGWVLDVSYGPGTSSITDGTSNTVLPAGLKT